MQGAVQVMAENLRAGVSCPVCGQRVKQGCRCQDCESRRLLKEQAQQALVWCRDQVERLAAEARDLLRRRRRDEARERMRAVRDVAWAAVELVTWIRPGSPAGRLLEAILAIKDALPRVVTEQPAEYLTDPELLARVAPGAPDRYAWEEEPADPIPYRRWDALCRQAGLTDREAEALLLVCGLGYRQVEAARIIGCKVSSLRWHLAGAKQKLRLLVGDLANVVG